MIAHEETILALYSGVSEREPWAKFLSDLVTLTNSSGASIMVSPPCGHDPIFFTYLINGKRKTNFGQDYARKFFETDPFVNLPEGEVQTRQEFLKDLSLNELEYYKELQKTGTYHIGGFDVSTTSGLKGCLRISRGKNRKNYSTKTKEKLEVIIPHFREAINLYEQRHRLETEVRAYESALDNLAMAAFLVASDGRVLKQNKMGKALVAERLGVTICNDALTFSDRATNKLFRRSLVQASSTKDKGDGGIKMVSVTNFDQNRTVHFALKSIADPSMPISKNTPVLAIYGKEPYGHVDINPEAISSLIGLTSTEAKLAVKLANYFDLNEVSKLMNISHNTARAHLRSIYSKTNITRQSELIRLVLRAGAELATNTDSFPD